MRIIYSAYHAIAYGPTDDDAVINRYVSDLREQADEEGYEDDILILDTEECTEDPIVDRIAQDAKPHVFNGLSLAPGTVLPNGSVVILAKATNQESQGRTLGYVLAYDGHDAAPWRTWALNLDDLRSTCWGHYFKDEDEALLDYIKRG